MGGCGNRLAGSFPVGSARRLGLVADHRGEHEQFSARIPCPLDSPCGAVGDSPFVCLRYVDLCGSVG
jgi:hypothetical protein